MGSDREATSEERQLALLVNSTLDYAIFMLDPTGQIVTWNAGAQRLKGYTREEIVGQHFSVFYPPEDVERGHPADELRLALRDGRYEEEGWRLRRDGSRFWASVTITAVHGDGRELVGFAKVTRDLTERRNAEQALRDAVEELAMANEELDRFSTIAAHDMTDPLRTISGFAELLERGDLRDETIVEYAGHIRSTSQRLTDMLHGLLTYARAGRTEHDRQPVDLAHVIDGVLGQLAGAITARKAEVHVSVSASALVAATESAVHTIVQNLVSNAIKFSSASSPSVRIQVEQTEAHAWLTTVTDNGDGISSADQVRIFKAFERADTSADRAGYGLGLAICKRLVEQHGGTLGIDSARGGGSAFWFTLPAWIL